jgi:hypothetical protein
MSYLETVHNYDHSTRQQRGKKRRLSNTKGKSPARGDPNVKHSTQASRLRNAFSEGIVGSVEAVSAITPDSGRSGAASEEGEEAGVGAAESAVALVVAVAEAIPPS